MYIVKMPWTAQWSWECIRDTGNKCIIWFVNNVFFHIPLLAARTAEFSYKHHEFYENIGNKYPLSDLRGTSYSYLHFLFFMIQRICFIENWFLHNYKNYKIMVLFPIFTQIFPSSLSSQAHIFSPFIFDLVFFSCSFTILCLFSTFSVLSMTWELYFLQLLHFNKHVFL